MYKEVKKKKKQKPIALEKTKAKPKTVSIYAVNKILIMLLVVFLSFFATYLYNELRSPVFEAVSKITIQMPGQNAVYPYDYNNYYLSQAQIRQHTDYMVSQTVLEALANDQDVQFVFTAEQQNQALWKKSYLSFGSSHSDATPFSLQERIARIDAALSIEFEQESQQVLLTAKDSNPFLVKLIVEKLPVIYQGFQKDMQSKQKSVSAIRQDLESKIDNSLKENRLGKGGFVALQSKVEEKKVDKNILKNIVETPSDMPFGLVGIVSMPKEALLINKHQKNVNLIIAILLGLLVGFGVARFWFYRAMTIQTEGHVEKYLHVPLLGSVLKQ